MKKDVLGIKIDDVNIDQALEVVKGWLKTKTSRYIVTPNPEIVVMAQKDQQLKEIISNADLAIPDGVGLKLLTDIVCYTPGIDLMEALIKSSLDYGFTIGLLGGSKGVAEKAAECLRKKYPGVKIVYANSDLIKLPKLDLLFVGFGAPKQEKWIAKNLDKLPVKVFMGVGGSFDFLSGRIPRAPKLIRKLGFEWLFRLRVQPWRIKRQMALLKFVYYIFRYDKVVI